MGLLLVGPCGSGPGHGFVAFGWGGGLLVPYTSISSGTAVGGSFFCVHLLVPSGVRYMVVSGAYGLWFL